MSSRFEKLSTEIFQILKGTGKTLTLFDNKGSRIYEPAQCRRMFAEPDRMMISIDEDGEDSGVTLYLSKNVDLSEVSRLITTMRQVTTRYNVLLNVRKYSKDLRPKDFSYQVQHDDTQLDESMWGSTKTSYQRIGSSKLIVRHCAPVIESSRGSRTRNILALFVETQQGERFKFPAIHLSGARAWARHLSENGSPHDQMGRHIVELSEDASNLSKVNRFIYYGRNNLLEEALQLREKIKSRIIEVRCSLQRLIKPRGYAKAMEAEDYSTRSIINEDEQKTLAQECLRLSEILGIDSNHALAEAIVPVALLTLGETTMKTTDQFCQIVALDENTMASLAEALSNEFGYTEGTHWIEANGGVAFLMPEAFDDAREYLTLNEQEFSVHEADDLDGDDSFSEPEAAQMPDHQDDALKFAIQWNANRAGIDPSEMDRDLLSASEQLAGGLRDLESGAADIHIGEVDGIPGFSDKSSRAAFLVSCFGEPGARCPNDALYNFMSDLIGKVERRARLSYPEARYAQMLANIAAEQLGTEGVHEDINEWYAPDSYQAGRAEANLEAVSDEAVSEFKSENMAYHFMSDRGLNSPPDESGEDVEQSITDMVGDLYGIIKQTYDSHDMENEHDAIKADAQFCFDEYIKPLILQKGYTFIEDKQPTDENLEAPENCQPGDLSMGDMVSTDKGAGKVEYADDQAVTVSYLNGDTEVLSYAEVSLVKKAEDSPEVPADPAMMAQLEEMFQSIQAGKLHEFDMGVASVPLAIVGANMAGRAVQGMMAGKKKDQAHATKTDFERQCVKLANGGMSYEDIADQLTSTPGKVLDTLSAYDIKAVSRNNNADVDESVLAGLAIAGGVAAAGAGAMRWSRDNEIKKMAKNGAGVEEICNKMNINSDQVWEIVRQARKPTAEDNELSRLRELAGFKSPVAENDEENMPTTHYYGGVRDEEAFIAIVNSKFGWAVREQAESVLNGEALEDQNSNALKYILEVARSRDEEELAEKLSEYLNDMQANGIPMDEETLGGDKGDDLGAEIAYDPTKRDRYRDKKADIGAYESVEKKSLDERLQEILGPDYEI